MPRLHIDASSRHAHPTRHHTPTRTHRHPKSTCRPRLLWVPADARGARGSAEARPPRLVRDQGRVARTAHRGARRRAPIPSQRCAELRALVRIRQSGAHRAGARGLTPEVATIAGVRAFRRRLGSHPALDRHRPCRCVVSMCVASTARSLLARSRRLRRSRDRGRVPGHCDDPVSTHERRPRAHLQSRAALIPPPRETGAARKRFRA